MILTLDKFIESRLVANAFPRNAYVKEPGFKALYVRMNRRFVADRVWNPVLDLANMEAARPGNGAFTALVKRLRHEHPSLGLFVESVMNPRFSAKLPTLGFKQVTPESALVPSFWLPPLVTSPLDNE